MSDIRPMRWVDRSRITTDWTCPRKRYLGYELDGRGISPAVTSLELHMGTVIHDALADIARAHQWRSIQGDGMTRCATIDEIASAAQRAMFDTLSAVAPGELVDADTLEFAREQAALVEGIIRGFYRHVWPRLLAAYPRIIAIEREVTYRLADGLTFMAKPDLLLASEDDEWVYIEYKSTSSKKQDWIDSWETAVQLHSGCKAVEETLGHPVSTVIVQGLYKGYESYGRQNSPFCYAYVRQGNPPFTVDQVEYAYKSGFRRSPTWERAGGVSAWVAGMPDNILADQFPQTPPIFVREELVASFFEQVKERELVIAQQVDPTATVLRSLDEVFPQHFDQCRPAWGRGCSYRRICHGQVDNPLTQGFTVRVSHHQPEADAHAAEAL